MTIGEALKEAAKMDLREDPEYLKYVDEIKANTEASKFLLTTMALMIKSNPMWAIMDPVETHRYLLVVLIMAFDAGRRYAESQPKQIEENKNEIPRVSET